MKACYGGCTLKRVCVCAMKREAQLYDGCLFVCPSLELAGGRKHHKKKTTGEKISGKPADWRGETDQ